MPRQTRRSWILRLLAAAVACSLFLADAQSPPYTQQGPKLAGAGGQSVALSADGNTAIVGNPNSNSGAGSAAVYTRSNGVWTQSAQLVGAGAAGPSAQGTSVAISADGSTAIIGGPADNASAGAAWVFTRSTAGQAQQWTQQGNKLAGAGAIGAAGQGNSVAIAADGNTALIGGPGDNGGGGAVWAFVRTSGAWTQQGNKLFGAGASGNAEQGASVALSADGSVAIVGGPGDNISSTASSTGAVWVFTRLGASWIQQGSKFSGPGVSGAIITPSSFGFSVALSGDGNTAIVGMPGAGATGFPGSVSYSVGAASEYTRANGMVWTQQATGFVGAGASNGASVALSADGNLAVVGAPRDGHQQGFAGVGAVSIWTRANGSWTQLGDKLIGADPLGSSVQGQSVALSADGNTILVGGPGDDSGGAVWFYIATAVSGCSYSLSAASLSMAGGAASQSVAVTAGPGCFWKAASNTNWISLTSSDSATGNGSVSFSVSANNSLASRSGSLTIAGLALAVTQNGLTPVTIFNTGVGPNGALSAGGSVDSHYALVASTDPAFPGPNALVAGSSGLPSSWLGDGPNSQWIAPRADAATGNVQGTYTYRTTFDLTGLSSSAASLTGQWATDNFGLMKLNGVPVGSSSTSNSAFTPFVVASGFVSGPNVLDFVVTNTSPLHPTGMRVEIGGVTQPATAADQSPAPTVVSPASGSGLSTTLTFTWSDPRGWQDLAVVNVLINNFVDGRAACYLALVPSGTAAASVFLVDDAGDAGGPYSGITLPGSGAARNSQCALSASGSSVAGSGNTLILTLAVAFQPGFAGNKIAWMAARDTAGNNSGWQPLGTWGVPAPAPPTGPAVTGVNPARANGSAQTFTFTFTDGSGWQDIAVANILIHSSLDGRQACYLAYVPSAAGGGSVFLVDDAGDAGGPYGGIVLPGNSTVQNSQCTVSGAGSFAVANGNALSLTLAIAFSQSFRGNQAIYLAAGNTTRNSNWQPVASFAVQ